MGLADDLLMLAGHLANPSTNQPEQAWLRRSVSTSYYALFHLLVGDAVQGWNGSLAARVGLERAFGHDNMYKVSQAVSQGSWRASAPTDVGVHRGGNLRGASACGTLEKCRAASYGR
jgi:hypothetical protein